MATTVRMPEVLAGASEAAIQSWSVAVGDSIAVGQPFAEIETDKAVVEYAAETAGTVLQLLVAEGDSVDVGTPIAVVGEPGEVAEVGDAGPAAGASAPAAPGEAEGAAPRDPESAAPVADARPVYDLPQEAVTETDAAAPPTPPDVAGGTTDASGRRFISPLVRRLAREHDLDLSSVRGSGPDGRIVRRDVEDLLAGAEPTSAAPIAVPEGAELVPHSRMRKAIARRLTESKNEVPHYYLHADCRVDRLLELRRELNAAATLKVSVNDLVVKAVAGAFVDVPEANRTWSDEGMLQHGSVDIAVAVALADGLVTPVVRGVERLSVTALGRQIADLAERARWGRLRQHEIEGGSFAVSNLGMFGTQEFSAIINPPQAGILAVGAARQAPVVVDGGLEVGTIMSVTLSADHRALDGALAARWLAAFVARIERPLTILA
ncbi:dihydrolipoamide acetyltransferase family protein [Agromyces sp. Marseille-P2726]|uniref:dihydrolipoamide acetyltransferase family protein n=1 Tax=Agromyces sp. Marseille-P2726 TaxID=2709132 RepID=UPI0015706BB5|nr:dihydrolipoamide acetyltransferase family protein [Agromyces sp. Marseille-P2726]